MRPAVAAMCVGALVGCGGATGDADGAGDLAFVDVSYALPEGAPSRFEFGAAADEARIALWDKDVKPDGEGLPRGSGSVAEGEVVFRTYCIACHGPTGTEGPNDVLVGSELWDAWPGSVTVGGYWPYATTLYDYISRAMPQLTPGVLTPDQTYAVIAYILNRNGIIAADARMDAESLPAVRMPARDRFVTDDRQGGAEIR